MEKRVDPSVLQTALLDEIAERLLHLEKMMEGDRTRGVHLPLEFEVGGEGRVMELEKEFGLIASGLTVYNDGPDDLYIGINRLKPEMSRESPLKPGESLDVDFRGPRIKVLAFLSKGSSKVRLHLVF